MKVKIGKTEIEILKPKNPFLGFNEFKKVKNNQGIIFNKPESITMQDTNENLKLLLIKNNRVKQIINAKKNTGLYDTKDYDVIEVKEKVDVKINDKITKLQTGGTLSNYKDKNFIKYLYLYKSDIEKGKIKKEHLKDLYNEFLKEKDFIPFDNIPYDETLISYFEHGGKMINDTDLYVITEKGVEHKIDNNSRIFSRVHTKQLFDNAVLALNEQGLKQLGKLFVKIVNQQNKQEQQWVNI